MSVLFGLLLLCQTTSGPCATTDLSACLAESRERGGYWDGDPMVRSPQTSQFEMARVLETPVTAPVALHLCVRVSAEGAVTDLVVRSEEGQDEDLSEPVKIMIRNIRSLPFKPGRLNGRDVDVWVPFTVRKAPRR